MKKNSLVLFLLVALRQFQHFLKPTIFHKTGLSVLTLLKQNDIFFLNIIKL